MPTINKFRIFISQFPHYTEEAFELIIPYLVNKSIKKGEHILLEGNRCRSISFIVSGLFKVYYIRDGIEITTCFCKEGRFTASYQSLISNEPSELSIQALEDSEIINIQYKHLKELYNQHLFWQQIGRMVTEQEYIIMECNTRLRNDKPAKQRYLDFINNEGDLLQRVSLIDLASYLQVTPETISRIRKDLSSS